MHALDGKPQCKTKRRQKERNLTRTGDSHYLSRSDLKLWGRTAIKFYQKLISILAKVEIKKENSDKMIDAVENVSSDSHCDKISSSGNSD